MVTSWVGSLVRVKTNSVLPPASVVVPLVGVTVIPAVSLSSRLVMSIVLVNPEIGRAHV